MTVTIMIICLVHVHVFIQLDAEIPDKCFTITEFPPSSFLFFCDLLTRTSTNVYIEENLRLKCVVFERLEFFFWTLHEPLSKSNLLI